MEEKKIRLNAEQKKLQGLFEDFGIEVFDSKMKEFKGTKEKWIFDENDFLLNDKSAYVSTISSCWTVAEVFDGSKNENPEVIKANARLIACAPELLRTLRGIQLSIMAHPDYVSGENQEFIDKADIAEEVINKALGIK